MPIGFSIVILTGIFSVGIWNAYLKRTAKIHQFLPPTVGPSRTVDPPQEFESLLASLKKEAGLMPGEAVSGLEEPELADLSLLDEHLDVGTDAVH